MTSEEQIPYLGGNRGTLLLSHIYIFFFVGGGGQANLFHVTREQVRHWKASKMIEGLI